MTKKAIFPNHLQLDKEPYIETTDIKGLLIVKRPVHPDRRGSFQEIFRTPDIERLLGKEIKIMQGSLAESEPGTLKGIHVEPQDKIVTPVSGKFAVFIVDLRTKSDTYKEWLRFEFDNSEDLLQRSSLVIPEGCGNSYCVYKGSGRALYYYNVTQVYNPASSGMGVRYDDPELDIPWPVDEPIVSDRDKNLPTLEEFVVRYRK